MGRFDRYLLSQLLALFGFFSLVLVAVYWVNRAVGLFDQLIGDGQSALVFLEFSVLTLPNVIRLVLPISAFAATVYVVNRLMQESELVVVQATGFSAFRLSRAVLYFALCVFAMMLVLMNYLVPASRTILAERSAEISQNTTAKFLNDGQFMHPVKGVTLYIREISETGELKDIFLSDERGVGDRLTYTARKALLVRGADAPKLIMINGMAQSISRTDERIAITRFQDFTLDLTDIVKTDLSLRRTTAELSTAELFFPSESLLQELGTDRAAFMYEGHVRIANPMLALATPLMGFAALMLGGFSRFGLWRQIAFSVGLLIAVQTVNTWATGQAMQNKNAVQYLYLGPILGIAVSVLLLWYSQIPRRRRRVQPDALGDLA